MVNVAYFDTSALLKQYLLDVMAITLETARQLVKHRPLRAYDAVQLATALLLNQDLLNSNDEPLAFVCADDRLISIAQAEGLLTENPNHHP